MASALLQQRMGAQGQNQNMDLMFRRDPRAATALIQAQMAAQEEAANRAQRSDLANQEMGYRNRSLDMQGQQAGDDRQAAMDRLLAGLAGQRGLASEQMKFQGSQADVARQAAMAEAAAQRAFQGSQQQNQQQFQGTLADKQMQHSTQSESRRAMLETMLKGMEISGLDKRSQDDMRTKMMAAYANLAESAGDPGYPAAKAELDKVFGGMNAQMTGMPAPQAAPAPKLAMDAVDQKLKSSWDAASMGKDGATKKPVTEFLKSIPAEDIKNNKAALQKYIAARYPDALPDRSYFSPWSSAAASEDEVRDKMGAKKSGNLWNDARSLYGLPWNGVGEKVDALRRLASPFMP